MRIKQEKTIEWKRERTSLGKGSGVRKRVLLDLLHGRFPGFPILFDSFLRAAT